MLTALIALLAVAALPLSQWLLQDHQRRLFSSLLAHLESIERVGGKPMPVVLSELEIMKSEADLKAKHFEEKANKYDRLQAHLTKRIFDPNDSAA